MQKINVQTDLLSLLKEHIKLSTYIPPEFRRAFYKYEGRPRGCTIESFMWYLILQSLTGIVNDNIFVALLRLCRELREFCGFESVPLADKMQNFVEYIGLVFEKFVDATELICRTLDPKKAAYLLYDTTGIEANVKENNPKFLNSKLNNAKKIATKNPEINAHSLAYFQMPETAEANPLVKQQLMNLLKNQKFSIFRFFYQVHCINGHFCYAFKACIITNGLVMNLLKNRQISFVRFFYQIH